MKNIFKIFFPDKDTSEEKKVLGYWDALIQARPKIIQNTLLPRRTKLREGNVVKTAKWSMN